MKQTITSTIIILLIVGVFAYVFPWRMINWGKIQYENSNTVSVVGYAESSQGNQMATFSATVTAINANKQVAIDKVNTDITDLISKLKTAGVSSDNIKTQSLNVYQNQDMSRLTDWNASNSIEIKIEFTDQSKVSELTKLLASSGTTNIWGPNFAVNTKNTLDEQKKLLDAAITDARSKAEIIAKASGRSLGRIISVSEGVTNGTMSQMYDRGMGGGGGNGVVEPGTSNIVQNVTVVFELK